MTRSAKRSGFARSGAASLARLAGMNEQPRVNDATTTEDRGVAEVAAIIAVYPAVKEIVKDVANAVGSGPGDETIAAPAPPAGTGAADD